MEICKVPTPQLKVLNKHNTQNVHEMGFIIRYLTKASTYMT